MSERRGGGTALPGTSALAARLERLVLIEPSEVKAFGLSFAMFFAVLASYYILRPLRDEMGVALGRDALQSLFTIVFLVMLAAVPVFGWVVANVARRWIVPAVYGFLLANLVAFRVAMGSGTPPPLVAAAFFVWVNVYVMFVVSLFWSLMSDVWSTAAAKRLYGVISVGGSAGALTGPTLIQLLLPSIGLANMLLLAAVFLTLAIAAAMALRRELARNGAAAAEPKEPAQKASLIAGALNVWRSPYLFRIAMWVLAANVIGMFFYIEQARIVGEAIANPAERVVLFARIEMVVSVLTFLLQGAVAARLIQVVGVGATAAVLPGLGVLALIALALAPVLGVIVTIMVLQRALAYGLGNPAMRTLYTVVEAGDKYRAQNFIDTVVYRGGDAASGWVFNGLSKAFGVATPVMALLTLPFAAAWLWLSFDLGRRQERELAVQSREPTR